MLGLSHVVTCDGKMSYLGLGGLDFRFGGSDGAGIVGDICFELVMKDLGFMLWWPSKIRIHFNLLIWFKILEFAIGFLVDFLYDS